MHKLSKILLAFIFLLLIFVILPHSIHAYEVNIDNTTYNIESNPLDVTTALHSTAEYISGNYFYITRKHTSGCFDFYFFEKSDLTPNFRLYVTRSRLNTYNILEYNFVNNGSSIDMVGYSYNPSTGVLGAPSSQNNSSFYSFNVIYNNNTVYMDSNTNVLWSSSGDTIFFQGAPIVVAQGILAPIVATAPAQRTLAEILGILPIVLVVIVSYLALRKGLAALFRLLHQS